MNERWSPIKGYPSYFISTLGAVRRLLKSGSYKQLKAVDNGNGYLRVNLYKEGVCKKFFLHRLVATAFLKNRNNLPQVHHKDHDKYNNTLPNLQWCSSEDNNKYKVLYYRQKKVKT